MADRRRTREPDATAFRRDDWRNLATALRREARAERPRFSRAIHEDALAALAANPAEQETAEPVPAARAGDQPAISRQRRGSAWAVVTGGLAAATCLAIAVATVPPRPAPPAAVPVATFADAGIERLPTPEEISASVFAQVATFAALAVGVPELPDLAALDPGLLAAADPGRIGSEQAAGDR
jgi:hypothetical protein